MACKGCGSIVSGPWGLGKCCEALRSSSPIPICLQGIRTPCLTRSLPFPPCTKEMELGTGQAFLGQPLSRVNVLVTSRPLVCPVQCQAKPALYLIAVSVADGATGPPLDSCPCLNQPCGGRVCVVPFFLVPFKPIQVLLALIEY